MTQVLPHQQKLASTVPGWPNMKHIIRIATTLSILSLIGLFGGCQTDPKSNSSKPWDRPFKDDTQKDLMFKVPPNRNRGEY